MESLKKKQSVLARLISLEKRNLETVRMEYAQLETLLGKSKKKELAISDDIFKLDEKYRAELLDFKIDTTSKLTQYRIYIDKKNIELIRQAKESNTIQHLLERVSKDLIKLSLKVNKIEDKYKDIMGLIKLELEKKEMKAADEMWLQRTVR